MTIKGILADLKQPSSFRMVSRAIPEVKKGEQIADELDVERSYHSTFGSFGGSLLCSYSVEEIEPRKRGKWIAELLQNHHTAIFLQKSGDGIAFFFEVTLLCCTTILMISQQWPQVQWSYSATEQKQQQQLHRSALLLMRPKISQLKVMITHKDTLQLSSMSIMILTSGLACFVNQELR